MLAPWGNATITQVADDLKDLTPGREGPFVDPLVIIDRQDELQELVRHLALFRLPAGIAPPPPGAPPPIQTAAAIDLAAATIRFPSLRASVFTHGVAGAPSSVDRG